MFRNFGGASSPIGLSKALRENPRYQRGFQMAQAGANTSPVQHWTQGLARMLQAGVGTWEMNKAEKEEEVAKKERNAKLADALRRMGSGDSSGMHELILADGDPSTAMRYGMYSMDRADRQKDREEDRGWRVEDRNATQAFQREMKGWELANRQGPAPVAALDLTTGKVAFVDANELRRNPGRYAPPDQAKSGMPFSGNGLDAQNLNILLTGDPSSPVYHAAYTHMARPKSQVDMQTGQVITTSPDMSPFRAPMLSGETPGQAGGMSGQGPQVGDRSQGGQPMPTQVSGQPSVSVSQMPGERKYSDGQQNANTYAMRIADANNIFDALAETNKIPDMAQRLIMRSGGQVGNMLVEPQTQQFDQAARNFINAVLRRESGAVINDSEFENADRQYLPVPGDSPQVLQQKKQNRQRALEGIATAAGRPPESYVGASPPPAQPAIPQQPSIPQQPQAPQQPGAVAAPAPPLPTPDAVGGRGENGQPSIDDLLNKYAPR